MNLQSPKNHVEEGSIQIDELRSTVSEALKALITSKNVQEGKAFHLNTDGTTLAQKN